VENLFDTLQNEPVVLVIIAVLAVGVAFLFTLPVFLKYTKSFDLPVIKASEVKPKKKEKVAAPKQKEAPKPRPSLGLTFNIRSVKILAPLVIVIVILLGGGYLAYDFFVRPVRIVAAGQFKLEKRGALSKLQERGLSAWPEAKLYLLDVRSRSSYAQDHVVGSESLPANRAKLEFYPIEGVPVAVYSSELNLDVAREVAEAISKNGESGRITYENPGKVYVIKDGFEGLKASGLKTEAGEWD
jgi:rhodanese-related sulfurtransferase